MTHQNGDGFGRPPRAAAFTLIEVLVVVSILALLAGLLLPALARVRAEGQRTACRGQLSQLVMAMQMYTSEHGFVYPSVALRPTLAPTEPRLRETLLSYLKDPRVLRCPADRQGFYEQEGSSYEWNTLLNGQRQDGFLEQVMRATPMFYDYENFHPDPGKGGYGGKNVAFCDGSVGD